jgi:peptidoglycan hydrolase-like protein with peptidoglycan-binding domain
MAHVASPEDLHLSAARLRAACTHVRSSHRTLRAEALGLAWQGPAARAFAELRLARREHAMAATERALTELAAHLERAARRLHVTLSALGPGPRLGLGDAGPHVAALQRLLAAAGHPTGGVDGCLGAHTVAAVRAFQLAHHLVVDGCVGPSTALALAVHADGAATGLAT